MFDLIVVPKNLGSVFLHWELGAIDDEKLVLYLSVCISFEGYEMWTLNEYVNPRTWTKLCLPPARFINDDEIALGIQSLRLMKLENTCILFRIEPFATFIMFDMVNARYSNVVAPDLEEDYYNVFPFVQST